SDDLIDPYVILIVVATLVSTHKAVRLVKGRELALRRRKVVQKLLRERVESVGWDDVSGELLAHAGCCIVSGRVKDRNRTAFCICQRGKISPAETCGNR